MQPAASFNSLHASNVAERDLTILLIEDDEIDVMNIRRAVEKLDLTCQLLVASDGQDALQQLREQSPEVLVRLVVVTDLNMPRMDGLSMMRELRKDANLRRLPVVVLTTSDRPSDRLAAFDCNVAGYLVKPERPAKLIEMVERVYAYWSSSRFGFSA